MTDQPTTRYCYRVNHRGEGQLDILPEGAVPTYQRGTPVPFILVDASDYDRDLGALLEQLVDAMQNTRRLVASNDALTQQVAAFKVQCACRYCKGHHFNISVCSKCAFTHKVDPFQVAHLQQQVARLEARMKWLEQLDKLYLNETIDIEYTRWLAAEPKEQG